jgi:ATP-dependent DNA helicase RecG
MTDFVFVVRGANKFGHNSMTVCSLHPESADQRQEFSLAEFREAFPKEGDYVEYKTSPARDPLGRTIVSFSNAAGGVVLVGVTDTGEPIHRGSVTSWMNSVHTIANAQRDIGRYYIRTVKVDGFTVLAVCVAARTNGVAQTSGGLPLIRRGDKDMPLFGADLADLVMSRMQAHYEENVSLVSLDQVPEEQLDAIGSLYRQAPDSERFLDSLRSDGLVTPAPDDHLTIAGVLFLTPEPRTHLGKAFVEVRRYQDDSTPDYDRRVEFVGTAGEQVRDATRFVMDELGSDFVLTHLYRYQLPRLPEVVLREAIANAVAHRSYEASGTSVVIEIRPSRVTVTSPGGLLDPVTEDNLRETQAARNPRVISVLRRWRLAEDAGRGIDVMQDEMSAALLDPPTFRDLGNVFEVLLPIHSPIAPEERAWVMELERQGGVNPTDRLLLIEAARRGRLTNSDARSVLATDAGNARAALKRLRDAGLLEQVGSRGGAYYTLSEDIAPPTFRMDLGQLLAYLVDQARVQPLTNRLVRELARVDSLDARMLLRQLVGDGRLVRRGERRGTHYVVRD